MRGQNKVRLYQRVQTSCRALGGQCVFCPCAAASTERHAGMALVLGLPSPTIRMRTRSARHGCLRQVNRSLTDVTTRPLRSAPHGGPSLAGAGGGRPTPRFRALLDTSPCVANTASPLAHPMAVCRRGAAHKVLGNALRLAETRRDNGARAPERMRERRPAGGRQASGTTWPMHEQR